MEECISADMDPDVNPQTQYHALDLSIDGCIDVIFEMSDM